MADLLQDLQTRKQALDTRRKLLAQKMGQPAPMPQGSMVGNIYVPPSWTQYLNAGVVSPLLNEWHKKKLDEEETTYNQDEAQAAEEHLASRPQGTQAIPFQPEWSEGTASDRMPAVEAKPAQPASPQDTIKWAQKGLRIPSRKEILTKLIADQEINAPVRAEARANRVEDREDNQQAARQAQIQKHEEFLVHLEETKRHNLEVANNQATSIENQRQARERADQTDRLIAAGNQELRRLQIEATQASKAASNQKLPAQAQKHQQSLMNLQSGLDAYKNLWADYDPQSNNATSPAKRAAISSAFTDMQMRLKEAYDLGAITGPDMKILEGVLSDPTSSIGTIRGAAFGRAPFDAQIKETGNILNRLKGNFESQYGVTIPTPRGASGSWDESKPPVKVKTPAEARKLAPGTKFVTPDGQVLER